MKTREGVESGSLTKWYKMWCLVVYRTKWGKTADLCVIYKLVFLPICGDFFFYFSSESMKSLLFLKQRGERRFLLLLCKDGDYHPFHIFIYRVLRHTLSRFSAPRLLVVVFKSPSSSAIGRVVISFCSLGQDRLRATLPQVAKVNKK